VDCDDANKCTTDSCVSGTSGYTCQHDPVTCPDDGDICTTAVCDKDKGCISTEKCDDGNACTEDDCNEETGNCRSRDLTCDDSDPCTDDSCDPATGCVFTPKACDDGDACTTDSCENGQCKHDPKCVPSDLCHTISCNADTGECSEEAPVDCPHDPSIPPCNDNLCDPADGQCKVAPQDCNDDDVCTDDSCDPSLGDHGDCVYTLNSNCTSCTKDSECDDTNPCTTDSCNTVLSIPTSKVCRHEDKNCDDSVDCTDDSCDPSTGDCVHTSNCPDTDNNKCTIESCNIYTNECSSVVKNCDDNNECTADSCDAATGECGHDWQEGCCVSDTDCDDSNACTTEYCENNTCHYTTIPDCSSN